MKKAKKPKWILINKETGSLHPYDHAPNHASNVYWMFKLVEHEFFTETREKI